VTPSVIARQRFHPAARAWQLRRRVDGQSQWALAFFAVILLGWAAAFPLGFRSSLTILTAVGFAGAVYGLKDPFVGGIGVGILCTLDALSRVYLFTGGLLRWNSFNYWLLGVMALQAFRLVAARHLPMRILAAFAALLVVQLWPSQDRRNGMVHILNLLSALGVFLYFLRFPKSPSAWFWLAALLGSVGAVGGFVFNLVRQTLPDINSNAYSYFPLTALAAICISFRRVEGRASRETLLLLLALINAIWVFLSASRGSLLIAAVCVLFLWISAPRSHQRLAIPVVVLLVLAGAGWHFREEYRYAAEKLLKLTDQGRTLANRTSGRSDLALAGWYSFCRSPLGIGTGGFAQEFAEEGATEVQSFRLGDRRQAHSAWIKTLVENGVVGTFLLVWFVLSFAWVGWRRRSAGVLPLGILVTGMLSVAFLSTEFAGKGLWFVVAGGTVSLYRGYRHRRGVRMVRRAPFGCPTRASGPASAGTARI